MWFTPGGVGFVLFPWFGKEATPVPYGYRRDQEVANPDGTRKRVRAPRYGPGKCPHCGQLWDGKYQTGDPVMDSKDRLLRPLPNLKIKVIGTGPDENDIMIDIFRRDGRGNWVHQHVIPDPAGLDNVMLSQDSTLDTDPGEG